MSLATLGLAILYLSVSIGMVMLCVACLYVAVCVVREVVDCVSRWRYEELRAGRREIDPGREEERAAGL